MLTSARASVVINATNFPDETFRQRIAEAEWDQDGNGTLSDEELAEVVSWELHDVENFKGLEHFTSLATLCIGRWSMEPGDYIHATNLDLSPFQQLWRFVFGGYDNTSVDVSVCVQMYDGAVQYTSSNEDVATVDANGVVTAKAEGEAVITAIGPETQNCYEAVKAEYRLTVVAGGAGVDSLTPDLSQGEGNYYNLQGRSVNPRTMRKGVFVVNGRKTVK
jgi:hypothetical protein